MPCRRPGTLRTDGTTARQIAIACAKNHTASAHNPKAQYRFPSLPRTRLPTGRSVGPSTRAMCAPIGDGAGRSAGLARAPGWRASPLKSARAPCASRPAR